MDFVNDIDVHHEVALTLVQLVGLIDGSIGYERHLMVVMNVIETELHAAAASMLALTKLLRNCLEDRP